MIRDFLKLTALLLLYGNLTAQTFYGNSIQKIELWFSQSNWDYQMDTAKAGSEGYILADWVKINGVQFDSVGAKYKGNSSYNAGNAKNPMHIELDYVLNQSYQNYTDIKLGNGFSDPSFVREVLSYDILRNYMHAPQCNFVQLYINGVYKGVYSNAESINKKFVSDHFYSSGNSFFKCNPQNTSMTAGPNLKYLGTDSTSYYTYYEIKSDFGWDDLIALCNTLNNNVTSLDQVLDVDRAIWMLAYNNVMVNLDSYTGGFTQNYYLYEDNNLRFNPIIWDLNMCFGGFNMTGSGGGLTVTQEQNMSPTLNSTNTYHPLIVKLLADARYKKMYIAHMKTITSEFISNNAYQTMANSYMSLIDTAVQSDNIKFFTYTQFQNSLTTNITSGPMTIPGIVTLMAARATYLNSTTEFTQVAPTISSVNSSPANPAISDTVWISANVTNTNYVYLGYRYNTPNIFIKTQMFDDGLHNDGAASDGVFGAYVVVSSSQVQYYIYAENSNAGMFSPQRAEHEYYTITATVPMANAGDIVINEFMPGNTVTVQDASGQFSDWIELYNNTSNAISLAGMYLSDNSLVPLKWEFPSDAVIAANGFLIVWCDEDTTEIGYHANFKLSANGEDVVLSYPGSITIDNTSFTAMTSDYSMERCPNGTGSFTSTSAPTYNALNCFVGVEENTVAQTIKVYPNPANDRINVFVENGFSQVELFNQLGQSVNLFNNNGTKSVSMDVSHLENGIYFIRINNSETIRFIVSH